jgi:hypothetical protein
MIVVLYFKLGENHKQHIPKQVTDLLIYFNALHLTLPFNCTSRSLTVSATAASKLSSLDE